MTQPSLKHKEAIAHMEAAFVYAKLSYCNRKKVGCIVVKDNRVISIGYNGTPSGWDNVCEDCDNRTLPQVYHAEANAIAKLASCTESSYDASVFLTSSPCYRCAQLLSQARVREVYYAEHYVSQSSDHQHLTGLDHLQQCGIPVHYLPIT